MERIRIVNIAKTNVKLLLHFYCFKQLSTYYYEWTVPIDLRTMDNNITTLRPYLYHVDGKNSIIKSINWQKHRLFTRRKRGMTIDLGYAHHLKQRLLMPDTKILSNMWQAYSVMLSLMKAKQEHWIYANFNSIEIITVRPQIQSKNR